MRRICGRGAVVLADDADVPLPPAMRDLSQLSVHDVALMDISTPSAQLECTYAMAVNTTYLDSHVDATAVAIIDRAVATNSTGASR